MTGGSRTIIDLTDGGRVGRIPALDGLRGVAIAMVLAGHVFRGLPGLAPAGVGLFFVLSGFLITSSLLFDLQRTGRISLARFHARRALRLLPTLLVLLGASAAVVLLATHGPTRSNAVRSLWSSALYVSNWLQALGHGYEPSLGHTWSLSTEQQFYLVWPLLLFGLCAFRARRRLVVSSLLVLIVSSAVLRAYLHVHPSPIRAGLYFSPITWADALLIGSLLGVVYAWRMRVPRVSGPALVVAFAFLAVAVASGSADLMFSGGATAMAMSFAVIVWSAVAPGPFARALSRRILRWLGRVSYGAYLWQGPIVWATMHHWRDAPIAVTGSFAIAWSLVAAWLSYRFVESPFLRMKDRFAGARPAPQSNEIRADPVPALEPVSTG